MAQRLPSSIRTLPSAPECHRVSASALAGYYRRLGIAPCPEGQREFDLKPDYSNAPKASQLRPHEWELWSCRLVQA